MNIRIDSELCVQCGSCLSSCGMMLIQSPESGGVPKPIRRAEEFCILCGHCVAACEVGAIAVNEITPVTSPNNADASLPTFEQFDALVRARRSIRRYKPEAVDPAKIEALLEMVRWAPSARNLLPVKWLVINRPQTVRELAGMVIEWLRPQEVMRQLIKTWDAGLDMVHRGAPCLLIAYTESDAIWGEIDSTIAVETVDLGAKAMGLGSCWAGYFIRASQCEPKIPERLGLRPDQKIHAALMLGEVADEHYCRTPFRKKADVRRAE